MDPAPFWCSRDCPWFFLEIAMETRYFKKSGRHSPESCSSTGQLNSMVSFPGAAEDRCLITLRLKAALPW